MNRYKARRLELDLRQDEVARATGLHPTQVSHYEAGEREPSVGNLIKLARALNCSADYLLGLSDNPGAIFVGIERVFKHAKSA